VPANERAERRIVSLINETPQQIPIGQISEAARRRQLLDVVQQRGGRGRCHRLILAWIWNYLYLLMRSKSEMARFSSDNAPSCWHVRRKSASSSGRDGRVASTISRATRGPRIHLASLILPDHQRCEDDPGSGGRYSRPIAKYKRLQERSEGLAGAVQSRLDGSRVDAQMLCRLFGVEFLNVAQDENLSVRIG